MSLLWLAALGTAMLVLSAFRSAFGKRPVSPDKAVIGNARQLAAAADQYYLDYGGTTVAIHNLVGATVYLNAVNTIAHETYPTAYTQGVTITITGVAGLRTITYAP